MFKMSDNILTWIDPNEIEQEAQQQIYNISKLPFIFKHVAIMGDCHLGKGATVGSVIPTKGAIVPSALGVDIGCGVHAVRLKLSASQLPDNLEKIRNGIERRIPLGAGGKNQEVRGSALKRVQRLKEITKADDIKHSNYYYDFAKWDQQLGSLGSGNHFIEICLDENKNVWILLHSGSRGVGNRIASFYINKAKKLMTDMFITLPDKDLAYLTQGTKDFDDYIRDMLWCQEYALLNRDEMMDRIMTEMSYSLFGENGHQTELESERIKCHHNYTQQENHMGDNIWVTRKGAIQMRKGQKGVIPGSMGTRSYIVSGLENPAAFHSAPHGAGRRFSRTEARRRFTMDDFDREMKGVECRRSEALIDELPSAYKDVDYVMECSKDLVVIEHTLKQIVSVKGD